MNREFVTLDQSYSRTLQIFEQLKQFYDCKLIPKLLHEFISSLAIASDFKIILQWWITPQSGYKKLSKYIQHDSKMKTIVSSYQNKDRSIISFDHFKKNALYCCQLFTSVRRLARGYINNNPEKMIETDLHRLKLWIQHFKRSDKKQHNEWIILITSDSGIIKANIKRWKNEDLDTDSFERWGGSISEYKKSQTKKWIHAVYRRLVQTGNVHYFDTISGYYEDIDTSIAIYKILKS